MNSDSDYSDCWMFSSTDSSDEEPCPGTTVHVRMKRGRKPMVKQYPQLVPVVTEYIQQHSAEAHNRRRDATAYTNGVTLTDIKEHVQKNVPGLDSISRMTIHRLLKPARRTARNAKRHSGLVDARVPPKVNNKTNEHSDFHYTCASINYMHELAFLCENETVSLSCDDKNKINVGTLAVSRHFQINRFFHRTDTPNYPDHDFPHMDSKLIPSGYMHLTRKHRTRSFCSPRRTEQGPGIKRARSESPKNRKQTNGIHKDKTGRRRVSWPRSGPLVVYLQAARFQNSTSQLHACHLLEVLGPAVQDKLGPKTVVTVVADGGPDWSTKSMVNLINYGRVWRDLNLDALLVGAYAPGHSRYNPIERPWGMLSKWLTGVTLPITVEGENIPPYKQTQLSQSERTKKEVKVFDNAIKTCSKYWNGKRYDSFPVITRCVPCRPQRRRAYNDHQLLKEFTDASARTINASPVLSSLREELQFLNDHCVRRKYQLEFYKCKSTTCIFCCSNPIRATKFFGFLERLGGRLPSPVPDTSRTKGEFMSLLRLLEVPSYVQPGLDSNLGTGILDVCQRGCQYVYLTKRDEKRHMTLCHSRT